MHLIRVFRRWLALALVGAGWQIQAQTALLVNSNSTWKYFKGRTEASAPDKAAWRQLNFNDATWSSGRSPFYYGENIAGGTLLNDMLNTYTTVFIRRTFVVTNLPMLADLALNAVCDDGFSAWINGVLVATYKTPAGEMLFNSVATSSTTEPAPFIQYPLPDLTSYLRAGTNVLAIQVLNVGLTSSDLVFDAELAAEFKEAVAPTIATVSPAPGDVTALNQITVTFSEPVAGVDAGDLMLNGVMATGVSSAGAAYTFTFPQPEFGVIQISWTVTHGIADTASSPNGFVATGATANWLYNLTDPNAPAIALLNPPAGLAVQNLAQVEVLFNEPVEGVDAKDLLINGNPATGVFGLAAGPYVFEFAPAPQGSVSLAWSPDHGITDGSVSANRFTGGTWTYTIRPDAQVGDLLITEVLGESGSGLKDEDGDPEDWIEIHNRGATPVNLAGWSLTDDAMDAGKWVFPAVTVAARQYLVVFASGKDRKPSAPGGKLHTNFKLNLLGEYVGLFSPESPRQIVSELAPKYEELRIDYSYGRDAGGAWRHFYPATPGAANGVSAISQVVAPVHFSVPSGFFQQPFNLHLSTPTPGASIYYTTNGIPPSPTNGFEYARPIPIASTKILRAAAFQTASLPSRIVTQTYLYGLASARRLLPALSLVAATNDLFGRTGIMETSPRNTTKHGIAWERPVSAELIHAAGGEGFQIDCGLRIQGGGYIRERYNYRGTAIPESKYSFRLYFRGDYGEGRLRHAWFPGIPIDSFDTVVLRAGMNDATNPFIRDELTRQLMGDTGQVASHGTFVNLFLNGVYKGYYNPTERIDNAFLQSWHGGGEKWDVIAQFNEIREGDNVAWNALKSFVSTKPATNAANYLEIEKRLDLANYIDYLLVNIYSAMGDWPHNNWRAARERVAGAKFRFYGWDAEWAYGFQNGVTWNTINNELNTDTEIANLYKKLKLSSEFRLLFADRVHRHLFNDGALADTCIRFRNDQLRTALAGTISGYNNTIGTSWIPSRRKNIITHLDRAGLLMSSNAPVFNQFGGRVPPGFALTMSALEGAIFYTTNGADPRVRFTGEIAPDALRYADPLGLNRDVVIKARTMVSATNWSALNEATFQMAALGLPVRFTEIMYHPPGGDGYEFLELQNLSGAPADLRGLSFSGVEFRFSESTPFLAPGARLLLSSELNPAAFAQRYPNARVDGRFSGSLDNGGERLALLGRNGLTLVSATFQDSGSWPQTADGNGHSLEIIDAHGAPNDPANWRASLQAGGSPGAANPTTPPPAVRLNEIMAENFSAVNHGGTYPDWIELHNPGGAAVDLAGWSLTDDGAARKFVFPAGTLLAAGGYLVVWCDAATNRTPGLHAGFALSNSGETISLFDALTNRADAVTFGQQLANFTLGRAGAGAGEWQLCEPSLLGVNEPAALAPAGSLAINEFMANPATGGGDWIELFNQHLTLPVALRGIYLGTSNALFQVQSPAFIAPGSFGLLLADEQPEEGADHLDFKLAAGAGAIVLSDDTGGEISRVTYGPQQEGVSQGRLPDGSGNWLNFSSSASPGTSNHLPAYSGPVFNEVLGRNETGVDATGRIADWIELFNPNPTAFDLSGMSVSVDRAEPGQWNFPPGTKVAAGGFLQLWCDGGRPASTIAEARLNVGRSLAAESGGAYLFNAAGQLLDSIEFGFQLPDQSIGRSGGAWNLMALPTPGTANSLPALMGNVSTLRLNEWMANPENGDDWFELFNPDPLPIHLGGLYLTDNPSLAGQTNFLVAPLTFIAGRGWVKFEADGQTGKGRHHASFSLDGQGELLRLYTPAFGIIDSVDFGAQAAGISEGRFPDGAANVIRFATTPSPGEGNYLPLTTVVINEVLSHTDPPLEDAIELYNPTPQPVDVSGWFLSNTAGQLKKFRMPDGTVVPAFGFRVLYEYQFNPAPGAPASFTLNSAHGDDVNLSSADAAGNLTGYRARQKFGAGENGISFGRHQTIAGVDFVAMSQRTFGEDSPLTLEEFRAGDGRANAHPKTGPIVINEIMYHPVAVAGATFTENTDDEFIELHNVTISATPLFDPAHPENRWRLGNAVEFEFPPNTQMEAGGYVIIVGFSPAADPGALAAFRAKYGLASNARIWGPYQGKLGNHSEIVELSKPDAPQLPPRPDAGFVPSILVDRVHYADALPWPAGADGTGASLQRQNPVWYGNDPANWRAAAPTPGRANLIAAPDGDGDGVLDDWEIAHGLDPNNRNDAALDADEDGLTNLQEFISGTDPRDGQSFLKIDSVALSHSDAGAMAVRFTATGGKTYTVQFRDSLAEGAWQRLTDVAAQPDIRGVEVLDPWPNATGHRFYRLVTPKQP